MLIYNLLSCFLQEIVVTGGIDDVVRLWNYKDGELSIRHKLADHSLGKQLS